MLIKKNKNRCGITNWLKLLRMPNNNTINQWNYFLKPINRELTMLNKSFSLSVLINHDGKKSFLVF